MTTYQNPTLLTPFQGSHPNQFEGKMNKQEVWRKQIPDFLSTFVLSTQFHLPPHILFHLLYLIPQTSPRLPYLHLDFKYASLAPFTLWLHNMALFTSSGMFLLSLLWHISHCLVSSTLHPVPWSFNFCGSGLWVSNLLLLMVRRWICDLRESGEIRYLEHITSPGKSCPSIFRYSASTLNVQQLTVCREKWGTQNNTLWRSP